MEIRTETKKHWNLSPTTKKRISIAVKKLRMTTPPGNRTHNLSNTRIYRIWHNMKTRCTNPKSKDYKNYGGRGIDYDPSWNVFSNFLSDMGSTYNDELQMDRINNDLGYSMENCRWTTSKVNQNNKRSNIYG